MTVHSTHRILGLVMLVPMILWSVTGFIFITKPGYDGAYERISPQQYPLGEGLTLNVEATWKDVQIKRSILGLHLLVNNENGWHQLDPNTFKPRAFPSKTEFTKLVNDAIKGNVERYGNIASIQNNTVTTDSGVVITLDWSTLTLSQKGDDTRLISQLYKIHYLQWFDVKSIDKVWGSLGLVGLVVLTILGALAYLMGRKRH